MTMAARSQIMNYAAFMNIQVRPINETGFILTYIHRDGIQIIVHSVDFHMLRMLWLIGSKLYF